MRIALISIYFSATSQASDVSAAFLRYLSAMPTDIVCPNGFIDHTDGHAFWWECGRTRGCPGDFPYADSYCHCACVLPTECVAKTPDDPCVTSWEPSAGGIITQLTTQLVPMSTLAPATQTTRVTTTGLAQALRGTTASPQLTTTPQARGSHKEEESARPASSQEGQVLLAILCSTLVCALGCFVVFCCIYFSSDSRSCLHRRNNATLRGKALPKRVVVTQTANPTLLSRASVHKALEYQPKEVWVPATSKASSIRANRPSQFSHDQWKLGQQTSFTLSPVPCLSYQEQQPQPLRSITGRPNHSARQDDICNGTPRSTTSDTSEHVGKSMKSTDLKQASESRKGSVLLTRDSNQIVPLAPRRQDSRLPTIPEEPTVCKAIMRSALGLSSVGYEVSSADETLDEH